MLQQSYRCWTQKVMPSRHNHCLRPPSSLGLDVINLWLRSSLYDINIFFIFRRSEDIFAIRGYPTADFFSHGPIQCSCFCSRCLSSYFRYCRTAGSHIALCREIIYECKNCTGWLVGRGESDLLSRSHCASDLGFALDSHLGILSFDWWTQGRKTVRAIRSHPYHPHSWLRISKLVVSFSNAKLQSRNSSW